MCDKAVNTCFLYFILFPINTRLKKCVTELFPEIFYANIFPDRYKTKKMWEDAVEDCLATLKLIPDWFLINEMLEKFRDDLLANYDILFFDKKFSKVTFFVNEQGILGRVS